MAEPLLGRGQLVVHWQRDAKLLQLVGATPGPAGVATIEFDGISVDLDVAFPEQVCVVSVQGVGNDHDLRAHHPLLRRLIGDERVEAVAQYLASTNDRPYRLGDDTPATRNRRGRVRMDVALLALALVQLGTPGLLPLERSVGVMEATELARRAELLDELGWLGAEFDLAVEIVLAADVDELAGLNRDDGVAEVCRQAAAAVSSDLLRRQLTALAVRIDRYREPSESQWALASPSAFGVVTPWMPREVRQSNVPAVEAADSLSQMVGGPELEVYHRSGDELVARLRGWGRRAEGWWLRVFHGDDQTPIAVVPFAEDDDGNAVAPFLAAGQYLDLLQVDVVEDPGEIRVPPEVGAFRRAVASGQRAARFERLGERQAASAAWQVCSEWHLSAGDDTRSKHAHAMADQQEMGSRARMGNPLRALLTDLPLSDPRVTR